MDNPVYYLQIYDLVKQREIGSYINYINGTLDDFEKIEQIKKEDRATMKEHFVFKKNVRDIKYTLVYLKSSSLRKKKDLLNNLIDILDYQGVYKMQDSYGCLTDVGKKYMIFSINQFIKKTKANKVNSSPKQSLKFFNNLFSSNPEQKNNENVQVERRKIYKFLARIFTIGKQEAVIVWVFAIVSLINILNYFIQIRKEKKNN